jgi:serine/threonine protein kinase
MADPPTLPPRVALTDFTQGDLIGGGAFGRVFRGRRNSDGLPVALKLLLYESSDQMKSFDREIAILSSQKHPTLLNCLGYIPPDPKSVSAGIVLGLAEGGSIDQYIERDSAGHTDPRWTVNRKHIILYGVAVGLSILHENHIIHRDLNPATFF